MTLTNVLRRSQFHMFIAIAWGALGCSETEPDPSRTDSAAETRAHGHSEVHGPGDVRSDSIEETGNDVAPGPPDVAVDTASDGPAPPRADGGGFATPDRVFYAATGESCCGEDPHPVHGIEAPDGGFVLCGKSVDSQGGNDGFVLKIDPPFPSGTVYMDEGEPYTFTWSQNFGSPGVNDAANSVVATGTGIFVAGVEAAQDGTLQASLRKYDAVSGGLLWSTVFPSSQASTESAFESIRITDDGGAILGGFRAGAKGGVEGFKSYGNPTSGQAHMTYLSSAQLAASTAPDTPTWVASHSGMGSIRTVVAGPGSGFVFVAPTAVDEHVYRVVGTDASGGQTWQTTLTEHGEATDMVLLTDDGVPTGFLVSGHTSKGGGIDGSVTKLSLDGDVLWHRTVGNPVGGEGAFAGLGAGNPLLIFDECWGVAPNDAGGGVLACGSGIEGCDELTPGSPLYNECVADPRTMWRAMLVALDGSGAELWSRVDSYAFPGEGEAAESASEYVFRTASGGYGSVVDQDFGIGMLLVQQP